MCSVTSRPRPYYLQGNSHQCLFNWGLFWPQNQSGEDFLVPPKILSPDRPALSLGIMTNELFWICYKNVSFDMSSGFDSYPLNLITVIHVLHRRKLRNEELYDCIPQKILFGSSNQVQWYQRCLCHVCGKERCLHNFGLGRENNIKMDYQEVESGNMDRIDLDQDRERWWAVVNAVMDLWVPWNAGKFLITWGRLSVSGRTPLHAISYLVSCYP